MSETVHLDHTHGLKLGPKIGPLPAGLWVVVIGGGLYVGYRRRQAAAATASPTGTDPAATQSSTDPSSAGYGLPGTGLPAEGGDTSSTLDPTDPNGTSLPTGPIVVVLPGLTPAGATSAPTPSRTTVLVSDPKRAPAPTPVPAPAPAPAKAPAKTPARTAPAPAPKTYTVRAGDTLSAIAAREHTTVTALYTANKAVIEAAAKAHGKSSSGGGHWIYPGTVLRVP